VLVRGVQLVEQAEGRQLPVLVQGDRLAEPQDPQVVLEERAVVVLGVRVGGGPDPLVRGVQRRRPGLVPALVVVGDELRAGRQDAVVGHLGEADPHVVATEPDAVGSPFSPVPNVQCPAVTTMVGLTSVPEQVNQPPGSSNRGSTAVGS
jgi:hypothetical protein